MFEMLIHFPREIRLGISSVIVSFWRCATNARISRSGGRVLFFSVFWSLFLRATRRERTVSCLPFRWGIGLGFVWRGRGWFVSIILYYH